MHQLHVHGGELINAGLTLQIHQVHKLLEIQGALCAGTSKTRCHKWSGHVVETFFLLLD